MWRDNVEPATGMECHTRPEIESSLVIMITSKSSRRQTNNAQCQSAFFLCKLSVTATETLAVSLMPLNALATS